MGSVWTLARKEIRQIFLSPIAYAFFIVFVFFVTTLFFRSFFLAGQTTMGRFFGFFPMAFAIVIPGLTMRMWAEERKQGTLEFLLTSPIETWHIVFGKFIGGLTLVAACLLLTLLAPWTVARYGDLDPGPVWGGYLAAVLMGGTFIAVGMFFSAFTQDQIVSFLATVSVLVCLVLLGESFFREEFGTGRFAGLARVISPSTHFQSMGRGVIDLGDVYYFVGIAALFLYGNVRVIDLRRWR